MMLRRLVLTFALLALATDLSADDLKRRGLIGLGFGPDPSGAIAVSQVRPGGPADKAGLKLGDIVKTLDKQPAGTTAEIVKSVQQTQAGKDIVFGIVRDGKAMDVTVTVEALPGESVDGSTVTYSSVTVPAGYKLRTIITEPKGAAGKSPAFMFVQGIGCASLDRPQSPEQTDTRLVHAMAEAGYVTLRVDKPGLGDSEGPPCGDIDFQTELDGYKAALHQLATLPSVDPERIYVFGHSMGGSMAPYLAQEVPIRGAIIYGTLTRTFLEYSIENARRQMRLHGANEAQITQALQGHSRMLSQMLLEKKSLGQIWDEHPELRIENDPFYEPSRMYGRAMEFFYQLQDLNLAEAWANADTNALAIHGEYDWVVSQEDHDMIASITATHPGRIGDSLVLAKTDHGFTTHDTLEESVTAMGQGEWNGELPKMVLGWIDKVEGRAEARPLAAGERPDASGAATPGVLGRDALAASLTAWTRFNTEAYPGKQDDIFFVSSKVGWYANGAGKIFKTEDGGASWVQKANMPGTYFRCLAFLDEKVGFAGNIGPDYFPNVSDTVPLYRTRDGGTTWEPVTIEGSRVVGLCALEVVRIPFVNAGNLDHKNRIVGVGRVGGPTAIVTSDDDGKTWQQGVFPAAGAMAFDVHFFDANHGVIASATSTDVQESRALILTTEDGGKSWREAYKGTRPFELTWKMSFPTREVGYVTFQSYDPDPKASQRMVAKTTDGGQTWNEIPLVDDHAVREFGIAFIDENHGWVGAMPGGFETTDGGKSWMRADIGNAVNKIRVLREDGATILHAIGVNASMLRVGN